MTTTFPLPLYPSQQTFKTLSPSQRATITQKISSALSSTLVLPPTKRDTPTTRAFVASYAKSTAHESLESLIWNNGEPQALSQDAKAIRVRVLQLAQKLSGLPIQILLDLSIVYSVQRSSVRVLFTTANTQDPSFSATFTSEVVPAFTSLLLSSHTSGLYVIRKTSHTLLCLLRALPSELIQLFVSKPFIVALGRAYGDGLASIARFHGGIDIENIHEEDEWQSTVMSAKVALIDAFHLILLALLSGISHAEGRELGVKSDSAFDIIFALLDIHSPSSSSTPFLNQSLLSDYQHAYSLSRTLARALPKDDPRMDILEATLASSGPTSDGPGALKILLRGSGVPPGIDNRGKGVASSSSKQLDTDLDMKVTQVLDILPDSNPEYIRALLSHGGYTSAEGVVEALLEGNAPKLEDLGHDAYKYTNERKNVWDEDEMDLSQVHIGKRKEVDELVQRDQTLIEQMKADILRRVEEFSDDDDEEDSKGAAVAYAEDVDSAVKGVIIMGDGEDSGEDDDDDEQKQLPETILELAYIRDPKLFERDAQTKRGKPRADLKAATGWSDEQIEGWRIMLERDPKKKEKILQKHEFSGNRHLSQSAEPVAGPSRGRGRGRGRGGGGNANQDDSARERARKDKNKASRGNHGRKRGHDKKMARAGAGALPG